MIVASRELSEANSYPTVPYEGDDEAYINENQSLVCRELAEFLTKSDRRELVDLLKNNPLNRKERPFIETMKSDKQGDLQYSLFSEETRDLLHEKKFKHEVFSDPSS